MDELPLQIRSPNDDILVMQKTRLLTSQLQKKRQPLVITQGLPYVRGNQHFKDKFIITSSPGSMMLKDLDYTKIDLRKHLLGGGIMSNEGRRVNQERSRSPNGKQKLNPLYMNSSLNRSRESGDRKLLLLSPLGAIKSINTMSSRAKREYKRKGIETSNKKIEEDDTRSSLAAVISPTRVILSKEAQFSEPIEEFLDHNITPQANIPLILHSSLELSNQNDTLQTKRYSKGRVVTFTNSLKLNTDRTATTAFMSKRFKQQSPKLHITSILTTAKAYLNKSNELAVHKRVDSMLQKMGNTITSPQTIKEVRSKSQLRQSITLDSHRLLTAQVRQRQQQSRLKQERNIDPMLAGWKVDEDTDSRVMTPDSVHSIVIDSRTINVRSSLATIRDTKNRSRIEKILKIPDTQRSLTPAEDSRRQYADKQLLQSRQQKSRKTTRSRVGGGNTLDKLGQIYAGMSMGKSNLKKLEPAPTKQYMGRSTQLLN